VCALVHFSYVTSCDTLHVGIRESRLGEWDLLGACAEMERARSLFGVRARLVAGACNVPNALIVPFRIELFRPAA
jgi:hypothetical protein